MGDSKNNSLIPKPVLEEIEHWIRAGKYGNISLNFQNGKIMSIKISESCILGNIGNGNVGFISATISTSVPQDDKN